ncbi:ribosomal protein S7p/S5e containing protein [Loa loa]|uniref:Small ribosomal subunit protein uS7m n=1 Tax=Loa loa TaxID=7209 RepID=A0A1S0U6N7_LOALO|nr:ribosomal protein S7p/S5e containing protein [Loa loa]EFO26021.1 ribosomal protein S7p/S5e containing protein [Loa loa]
MKLLVKLLENGSYLCVHSITSRRLLSGSTVLCSRYDPKVFREPIVDLEQLNQPLDPEDDRRYCYIKAMTSVQTPVFYRNAVIDRLINVCMLRGMKEKMQNIVLEALEIIKRRQYNLWRNASDEQKEKIELDPVAITEKAIKNCCPIMILRPFIRGGQTYMVPCPISEHHAEFRAMKTMRDICRQKTFHGATHFQHILADELLAAYKNEGLTVQAKQELHKQCEANRAYVHYRRQ